MQNEKGCGLLIWKDEVSIDKSSYAISIRRNDGFDEEDDNFVARFKNKLDAIERKLDNVEQISRKLIGQFFIICCDLFVAYMANGKCKTSMIM